MRLQDGQESEPKIAAWKRNWLTIQIWIFIIVASVVVTFFLLHVRSFDKDLKSKILEHTYQFVLIGIVGGAVSLFYKEYLGRRERAHKEFLMERDQVRREAQARRVFLRRTYSELLNAYNSAKTVRRTLRVRTGYTATPEKAMIKGSDYQEQMEILNSAQLMFEVYKKITDPENKDLFLPYREEFHESCGKIEGYLGNIISEYEKEFISFTRAVPRRRVTELDQLPEFIGPHKRGAAFETEFQSPFKTALKALISSELGAGKVELSKKTQSVPS